MTLTLAQRTQLRKRAAAEAAAVAPLALMEGATHYEVMLAKLQQDQFRLKQVQSTQRKAVVKASMLGEYVPYVEGVLSAGQGAQDDVLVTIMIWRLDAGDFAGGLDIAAYVLEHGLKTPTVSPARPVAWWWKKWPRPRSTPRRLATASRGRSSPAPLCSPKTRTCRTRSAPS